MVRQTNINEYRVSTYSIVNIIQRSGQNLYNNHPKITHIQDIHGHNYILRLVYSDALPKLCLTVLRLHMPEIK